MSTTEEQGALPPIVPAEHDNLVVVANLVDIATEIINNVSGNLVSNHLEGVPLDDRILAAIITADINNAIGGPIHA